MRSACTRCAPSATNISPTADFPEAIPPVSPTFSNRPPAAESAQRKPGGTKNKNKIKTFVSAPLCLWGERLSFWGEFRHTAAAAHLRGFHGVVHQHGDGQRPYAARHWRQRARHFRHFRVNVAHQHRALRSKRFFPARGIGRAAEQALKLSRVGDLVHAHI